MSYDHFIHAVRLSHHHHLNLDRTPQVLHLHCYVRLGANATLLLLQSHLCITMVSTVKDDQQIAFSLVALNFQSPGFVSTMCS